LAVGEIGGGGSSEGWSLAVGSSTDGGGPAAMVAEGHRQQLLLSLVSENGRKE
jgi:hypothetical protein